MSIRRRRARQVPPADHDRATVCEGEPVSRLRLEPASGLVRRAQRRPHVVVVGAGIAGLAAAHALLADGRVAVTVIERSPRTGGKLLRGTIAGITTDLGAEAVLARRPEGVALMAQLGLEAVHPQTTWRAIWSRGDMRALPPVTSWECLSSLRRLSASGVVSRVGVARGARPGPAATPVGDDVSVAAFVGARLDARLSTVWSSRCSAGSMPAAPTSSRCGRRCRRSPRSPGSGRCCTRSRSRGYACRARFRRPDRRESVVSPRR